MAYVLRHNPVRYGLAPDQHGFIHLADFFAVAHRRYPGLTLERLRTLVEEEPRRRFEILDHRLRARYGHSIVAEPVGEPVVPPARLYHGTELARSGRIFAEGLKPVERQMVHLSATMEDAIAVARRGSTRFGRASTGSALALSEAQPSRRARSPRPEQAERVEGRHTREPLILCIAAEAAHQAGIEFFHEGDVYLATHIPPQYLRVESPAQPEGVPDPDR